MLNLDLRDVAKLNIFYDFADNLALLSTCKRSAVGAIIINPTFLSVFSIGYNGQPRGIGHDKCSAVQDQCGCVHAEANAVIKLRTTQENLIMLSTVAPCRRCAGLIINDGRIKSVIWMKPYRNDHGLELIQESHVTSYHLSQIGKS